jgi:hypothetical protein
MWIFELGSEEVRGKGGCHVDERMNHSVVTPT